MKKRMGTFQILGYVLAGIGILGLLLSFDAAKNIIPFLSGVGDSYIIISALVLVGLGVILMITGGSEKSQKEVPIYHGKKIVGYRRH